MDIELGLRQLLVLRDPGVRFTDGVMARVGDTPVPQSQAGVVQLADARARRRSRRILFITVIAIGVAAAMPMLWLRDPAEQSVVQGTPSTVGAPPSAAASSDVAIAGVAAESGESPDPLQCLDPDVIRGILLGGAGSQTFSVATDLPPELAGFKAPGQFAWLGSTVRSLSGSASQSTVSVVYRADLSPDAARAAGVQALTASGWTLHSSGYITPSSIFTAGDARVTGENYCREGKPVEITASALEGVTYVVLSISRNQDRTTGFTNACDQPPQAVVRQASALDQFMPTLQAPRDRATGQPVSMLGGGSSGGDAKRSGNVSFTIQESIGNVAQHFAAQLAQQGWSPEANWSGTGTAGSTWTRMDAETTLQGTLMVLSFGEGRFSAVFRAVRTK